MSDLFYFGNRCLCTGTVTHYSTNIQNCEGCLQVASVYIPCYQMPEINLLGVVPIDTYNDYGVCTEGFNIQIISTSLNITASVDAENNIEFTFTEYALTEGEIGVIHYKVICAKNGMSANGYIQLCHPVNTVP